MILLLGESETACKQEAQREHARENIPEKNKKACK